MNININNQAISLHSLPNSFFKKDLSASVETKIIESLPQNVAFVKIQADKDVYYLANQTGSATKDGFLLPAGTEKIFCRRDALGLLLSAPQATTVKVQPLSHD